MSDSTDTIFALSSGRPPAAIAVIRLSGPRAGHALTALTGRLPDPRKAALARVRDPQSGEVLDEALALWFPGPNSETGEDTAELQLHGGRAVIAAVLGALGRIEGLRPAEGGEFTRRAFENGRMDLTAVEGLADLIGAETEAQRRQAYRQLKGLLGHRAETWRQRLIEALALVEARIDFSDEADVPEDLVGPALAIVRQLRAEIAEALAGAERGERLRDGLVVAIAGPPNAGKSTLLNRIARRDVAIVSPVAGTTRDVIEVHLDLGGYPVTLLDTAGIRESGDAVEQEGVRRARQRAAEADLVLWLTEAGADPLAVPPEFQPGGRLAAERDAGPGGSGDAGFGDVTPPYGASSGETGVRPAFVDVDPVLRGRLTPESVPAPPIWRVVTKSDISLQRNENEFNKESISFILSAKTGVGLDPLVSALSNYAATFFSATSGALVTRERHRNALIQTIHSLDQIMNQDSFVEEALFAEELRLASRALGRLLGRVDVEDVLDVIFRDFCIGK